MSVTAISPSAATTESVETIYLVDSRANLIIEQGEKRMIFNPAGALELLKFLERTGYQAHANSLVKGAPL